MAFLTGFPSMDRNTNWIFYRVWRSMEKRLVPPPSWKQLFPSFLPPLFNLDPSFSFFPFPLSFSSSSDFVIGTWLDGSWVKASSGNPTDRASERACWLSCIYLLVNVKAREKEKKGGYIYLRETRTETLAKKNCWIKFKSNVIRKHVFKYDTLL